MRCRAPGLGYGHYSGRRRRNGILPYRGPHGPNSHSLLSLPAEKSEMKQSLRSCVIILCISAAGCRKTLRLSEAVGKVVQSDATRLNLSSVADFAWEDVYVFGPYTPRTFECQTLKRSVSQCSHEDLREVDEGENLMVFLHESSVNRVESIPRTIVDFDSSCLNSDFKRATAEFLVEKRPRAHIVCH